MVYMNVEVLHNLYRYTNTYDIGVVLYNVLV